MNDYYPIFLIGIIVVYASILIFTQYANRKSIALLKRLNRDTINELSVERMKLIDCNMRYEVEKNKVKGLERELDEKQNTIDDLEKALKAKLSNIGHKPARAIPSPDSDDDDEYVEVYDMGSRTTTRFPVPPIPKSFINVSPPPPYTSADLAKQLIHTKQELPDIEEKDDDA